MILEGPIQLPDDLREAVGYLATRLQQVYDAVFQLNDNFFVPKPAEPQKPREGDIVFADGTNWNPGSGKGLYQYLGGVWKYL